MPQQPLASLLRTLFTDGQLVLAQRSQLDATAADDQALEVLRHAFAAHRLGVAGPAIDFDADVALAAARLVERAGWFLVSFQESPEEVRRAVAFLPQPRNASQHLSADLLLRYVPLLYRRAKALSAQDTLAAALADVLRRWPLSGVLADLDEGPLGGLDCAGHPGLQLLYAERLAKHFKPLWLPETSARAYVDLVWSELGKDPRLLANPAAAVVSLTGEE